MLTKKKIENTNNVIPEVANGEMGKLSVTKVVEVKSGETVYGESVTFDENMVSKGDRTEVANGKMREGSSITKMLEVKSCETGYGKTETSDANMVSKGEQVTNGKIVETEATDVNVNGHGKKKMKRKSKNKQPTLGEELNLQNLETAKGETGSGAVLTDNPAQLNWGKDQAETTNIDANMVSNGGYTEAANGKMRETETRNINVNGKGKNEKKMGGKNKRPTLGEILNPQNFEGAKGEMGPGTTSTDDPASKNQKRQKLDKNPDLGDILRTHENTQEGLSSTKVLEVKSAEMVSAETGSVDANMVSKGDHTEVANGKMEETDTTSINVNGIGKKKRKQKSKNKQPALGEDSNPQYLQNLEAAKGERGSCTTTADNPASETQKTQKLEENPDAGVILCTRENIQEGLSTTNVLEVQSSKLVLNETGSPDANMVSKGNHTEVANGKIRESETTNFNVNGKEINKNKLNSNNKQPTLGEILNPHYLQNLEAAKGDTGSVTISTGNTASKKRKREKTKKNNNSDSGDILSTHEITQEGLSTNQVLEVKSGETICGKTATPDANMVSKEDHTAVANGKTGESETTNVNVNGKKNRRKPKSKNKQPNLGETLNPQHLELVEASDGATNSKNSEMRNSQDTIIMNKGPGTAKSETRDPQEIVDVEKCGSTIADAESTMLKSIVCPQVANSDVDSTTIVLKSAEPADLEITEAKANKALARKDITQVATLGKKLIILDVNGLLADIVPRRPNHNKGHNYINTRKRTIFKRPYLDEFLSFCFERFNVAIWSSRCIQNLDPAVDYLLGDLKKKLLFMWDGSRCTCAGMGTLEKQIKGIVAKDLRKVWNEDGPCNAWVKGTFHESNTLLIDDSPYKALLNPKHTGIFPASYSYKNTNDKFLAPKGYFQFYLEARIGTFTRAFSIV
ncbi:hypothetical protein QVD17_09832 [Tagetes erecta]|uniref:FCP1 homology domain-containing protein n=1 Tax=Tagetes erecta TaxID=13708 RepID=A0AAD8L011_TARER|nr:hypothetical protein QVD17_09832 [Tagetes erecta]